MEGLVGKWQETKEEDKGDKDFCSKVCQCLFFTQYVKC